MKPITLFSSALFALLLSAANACAVNSTVTCGNVNATVGDSFSVAVTATQLSDVLGYSFRLAYDPAKLAVEVIAVGDYLSACGSGTVPLKINGSGSVGVDNVCLGSTVSSGTVLGTITFKALAAGNVLLHVNGTTITIGQNPTASAVVTEVDGTAAISPVTASAAVGAGSVRVNSTVTVQVNASRLNDVQGYSFRISYDPAKLVATGVAVGDYLSACSNRTNIVINSSGLIGLDSVCLGEAVDSANVLSSVSFKALDAGNASLDLLNTTITLERNLSALVEEHDAVLSILLAPEKEGDSNGDGLVNYTDLLALAGSYGRSEGDGAYNASADLNGDGKVDYADLLILAANYGR